VSETFLTRVKRFSDTCQKLQEALNGDFKTAKS